MKSSVVLLLAAASVLSCKTPNQAGTEPGAELAGAFSSGDLDSLVKTRLGMVCGFLKTSEDAMCRHALIEAVCSQGRTSLADAITDLIDESSVKGLVSDPQTAAVVKDAFYKEFVETIRGGNATKAAENFRSAANRCMNKEKIAEAEDFDRLASTPEFKSKAQQARRDFWLGVLTGLALDLARPMIQQGVQSAVQRGLARKFSPSTMWSVHQLFGFGVCSAGAESIAAFMADPEVDWNKSACADVGRMQKGQLKSCTRTVGSACRAASGAVDLRNLGLSTESDILDFLLTTSNLGLGTACMAGGKVTAAACGAISEAANQIGQALRTGNNDWARCLGISDAAACIGERWASGGWNNNKGVAMPRREKSQQGVEHWVRRCCFCLEADYTDKGAFSSAKLVAARSFMSVIQDGDFSSGNCPRNARSAAALPGTTNPVVYRVIEQCRAIDVLGTSCAVMRTGSEDRNGPAVPYEQPLPVWHQSSRSLDGTVIRHNLPPDEYRRRGGSVSR